jgi:hypothetical protein
MSKDIPEDIDGSFTYALHRFCPKARLMARPLPCALLKPTR